MHSYVGDAIFVVWPLSNDKALNQRVFKTLYELHTICIEKEELVFKEFGVRPKIRAAIHSGPIVIGEMGQSKKQITYLGNTLNIAAKLENMCKALDVPYLATNEVLKHTTLPNGMLQIEKGNKTIKGLAKELAVSQIVIEAK